MIFCIFDAFLGLREVSWADEHDFHAWTLGEPAEVRAFLKENLVRADVVGPDFADRAFYNELISVPESGFG